MVMTKIRKPELRLLDASLRSLKNAYVLWGFKVGAAVFAEDGQFYEGCNIESWVSGLGICAERCAIDHAVLHGNKKIKEMAVVIEAYSRSELTPCGACLQYISNFAANSKIKVIMAKTERDEILSKTVCIKTLDELFPFAYKK